MRIESVQEFQKLFDSQRLRVKQLRKIAQQQGDSEADALLRQVWLRLRQGPVRALVMGVSSAGKSTLINALVRNIVVPEGSYITSPIPVWIYSDQYAGSNPYTTILQEENGEFVGKATGQYGHITKYCYNPKQAGEGSGQREFEKVISAAINVKSDVVSDTGITLIDTPGIGVSLTDNARVQQIIKDSCELLIVVFHNLQDENVKAYFRSLLLDEGASLDSLLDDSRVFMVLNSLCHYTAHAKMDAGFHIAEAFDGRVSEERLFVLNALHARLKSCGIYPYPALMPDGFNREDFNQAVKSEALEKQQLQRATHQGDLDLLREALAQEAEYLCTDPEEVFRIWNPIQEKIDAAVARLKTPLEEKRKLAEKMSYPVPPELQEKLEALNGLHQAIIDWDPIAQETLTSGLAYSKQHFPMDALMKNFRKHKTIDPDGLLTDNTAAAEQFLKQEFAEENGPSGLVLLIKTRLKNYKEPLLALLESDQENHERKYWQKKFRKLQEMLSTFCFDDSADGQRGMDGFQSSVAEAYEKAGAAGAQALQASHCFNIATEDQQNLLAYLKDMQSKIRAEGMRGRWNRFWLHSNVKVDRLAPLLEKALREGATAYMSAFRESFWSNSEALYYQYHALLMQDKEVVARRMTAVREQISEVQETAKNAALAEIDKQLKELDV